MTKNKKIKWTMAFLITGILIQIISPIQVTAAQMNDQKKDIIEEAQALAPISIRMIDQTIALLSNGLSNLDTEERDLLFDIYDPGNTGEIDQAFVNQMILNYKKIRDRMSDGMIMAYSENSAMCTGMRLYYTDFVRIYICPYFSHEDDDLRKARVLIHEVAHMALLVTDRPYYDPRSYSARYNALTPEGSWVTKMPVIGPIIREIAQADTLYHPDTYSWFATLVTQ